MKRIRVKIEGLCDAATAARVAIMGADAIGLVFADSPRRVSAEAAREIVGSLGPWVAGVGVFVNEQPDAINRIVERTGIGCVQLHGDEAPQVVERIAVPCIKAFRVRDVAWLDQVRAWLDGLADRSRLKAVLLDAYDSAARGGTGRRFNWELVAQARRAGRTDDLGPIILAGGLDASCVEESVRMVEPWGVDVASGVESSPGVKDFQKIERFLLAVRRAEANLATLWDDAS